MHTYRARIVWGIKLAIGLFVVYALHACTSSPPVKQPEKSALAWENRDTTVSPHQNFYRYVNGTWIDNTEIPSNRSRWGSFSELRETSRETIKRILEEAQNIPETLSEDQQKAILFYQIGIDSARAETKQTEPIEPYLTSVDNAKNKTELTALLPSLHQIGVGVLFNDGVTADQKNSEVNLFYLYRGTLGMPDRDYYLNDTEKFKETKEKYKTYISNILQLIGYAPTASSQSAAQILAMETEMAAAMLDKVDARNPDKTYNRIKRTEINNYTPIIPWEDYFKHIGIEAEEIVLTQPKFYRALQEILEKSDLNVIKDYIKFHITSSFAPYLHHRVVKEHFHFYRKALRGTEEMLPRWERVYSATDRALGEAIGQLYVIKAFPPEAKEKAKEMVDNILYAFGKRIENLTWMSEKTKKQALGKLATFTVKIGYPDKWKDFSDLEIGEDSYANNVISERKFRRRDNLADIQKPVDKTRWFMSPQTVNAYYYPINNEIVFPAAILQPPFYNYSADEAINYGGIGAVIGHEISHGFDDNGSKYDGRGNLNNWWTEEDKKQFEERAQRLVDQYNAYEPVDSVFVNGKFTLGENIADLAGVATAYDGLMHYYKKLGEKPSLIEDLTPEQRFFMSWGVIWRTKYREDHIRNMVLTDPHSPAMYRANGPLSNLETFYKAFNVTENHDMYLPEDQRATIW